MLPQNLGDVEPSPPGFVAREKVELLQSLRFRFVWFEEPMLLFPEYIGDDVLGPENGFAFI